MSHPDVLLVSMPWDSLAFPSIQLGTLKALLAKASVTTEVRHYGLSLMDHFAAADLPEGERITVADYTKVGSVHFSVGLGDWIFAVPPYREPDEARDREYLIHTLQRGLSQEDVALARRMRRLVPSFLEQCAEEILELGPRIVGFTTMFSQNVASLALSKMLKERDPSLRVLFGGANCEGKMGAALHRAFPWVDVVVRGEAERVLPSLVEDLLSGRAVRPQPGLCFRDASGPVAVEHDSAVKVPMDDVPTPDYDDYFEHLSRSSFGREIHEAIRLPYESARGCWWGQIQHCTFCGLNGSTMAFRSKSPARVLEELTALAGRYRRLDFQVVDNIIDLGYLRDLLPGLRDSGHDITLFYETKSNLKKHEVKLLRDARVRLIQPGIESLSTPILKLMRKGVSALQNVRLLKWAQQYEVGVLWNLIYGFPGEPPEEYERMAEAMAALVHLPPPTLNRLHVDRFSPYQVNPGEFGIEVTGPVGYYRFLYPVDDATLSELAYQFDYRYLDGRNPEDYVTETRRAVEAWQEAWDAGASLRYQRGPGFVTIVDGREKGQVTKFDLEGPAAAAYVACDAGATPAAVRRALEARGQATLGEAELRGLLDELTREGLMFVEGDRYLSLALPEYPDLADPLPPPATEAEPSRRRDLVTLKVPRGPRASLDVD